MIQNSIQLLDLIAYAFVASQPIFYLLAMSRTVKEMRAESFIELRNLLNRHLQTSLRVTYYFSLLISLVWCYLAIVSHSEILIISSLLALLALIVDITLLLRGDQPINKVISTWKADSYPPNWQDYRRKWFFHYHIRQVAGLLGFLSLLAGAVFR
jgi:hypothetical protein